MAKTSSTASASTRCVCVCVCLHEVARELTAANPPPPPPPPLSLSLWQYMEQLLAAGESLEFFLEGGRSRSGKPCCPKAGLLSVVVDAVREGM